MTTPLSTDRGGAPVVSLVVAVYDVEQYLPDFLASLDAQLCATDLWEVVFVVDGSPDGSEAVIRAWMQETQVSARVLVKENGGVSSARNAGLDLALGAWVGFPDPDDVLDEAWMQTVLGAAAEPETTDASMLITRLLQFTSSPDVLLAPHPLDWRFHGPDRLVDLAHSSRYIHLHAASSLFRRDALRTSGLRFDQRIHIFEDAKFVAEHLLWAGSVVRLLPTARYYYRKRADNSSTMGTAWSKPAKYTDVLEWGHLDLLKSVTGAVPRWLQYTVFYDLQWYPRADERNQSETAGLSREVLDRFHELLVQVLGYLDDEVFLAFNAVGVPIRMRLAMLSLKSSRYEPAAAHIVRLDAAQELVKLEFFTSELHPDVTLQLDGVPSQPVHAKTTALEYFGRPWLYNRELWVTALSPVSVRLDGRLLPIRAQAAEAPLYESAPRAYWKRASRRRFPGQQYVKHQVLHAENHPVTTEATPEPQDVRPADFASSDLTVPFTPVDKVRAPRLLGRVNRSKRTALKLTRSGLRFLGLEVRRAKMPMRRGQKVAWKARTKLRGDRYAKAWVFIDRDTMAQDNAEAMYRHVAERHPDVNSWFVISRTSPDWERLKQDGFRLVDYGSLEHVILMRRAVYLLSSQADRYILAPYDTRTYGGGSWRFVFLQHGVTHNDLSRWLNPKPIHLFVTATVDEHQAIVGDGSPFRFSQKEVRRTGFPRHDLLREKAPSRPETERRSILVMPTWRNSLQTPPVVGGRRDLQPGFADSAYAHQWAAFLASDRLRAAAAEHDLDICFAPHPNFQVHLDVFRVPHDVEVVRYLESDIQKVIARAAVMVTDYSSLAFEAAFIDTPVVYFQFDYDDFFSGAHALRRGRFDYSSDGFGPVARTVDGTLDGLERMLDPDGAERMMYQERISGTFGTRDTGASERVYQEILKLEQTGRRAPA